jgi:superfamily II DNA or RNA helicase
MKNKVVTIIQKDSHWAIVNGPEEHKSAIWEILSYEKMVKLRYKPRPEKMTFSYFTKKGNKFPYGLVDYVSDKLIDQGYEVEIKEINKGLKPILKPKIPGIIFEDYQDRVLKIAGKHNRGIFIAATASGKSLMAAGIVAKYDIPVSLIVTINKTIFNQMVKDFTKWFPDVEIGVVGNGECVISHITIALYQSLARYDLKKYNKELELICWDEIHSAGNSVTKVLSQLTNCYNIYGLTATPHREEQNKQKYLEMIGNIGPIIEEVKDEEVSARVTDVEVYMTNYICKNPKGKTYRDCFKQDIQLSEDRNTKLLKAAKRLLLDKGKTCLVVVSEISQVNEMEKVAKKLGLKPKIAHGKKESEINENIKNLLNDKKVNLVIATGIFSTGTNIVTLDGVVLGSARKSVINIIQIIGRARRKTDGKDKAIVIDSYDRILQPKKERKFYDYFEDYSIERIKLYKEKGWFKKKLLI